jgi:hypothetical protein
VKKERRRRRRRRKRKKRIRLSFGAVLYRSFGSQYTSFHVHLTKIALLTELITRTKGCPRFKWTEADVSLMIACMAKYKVARNIKLDKKCLRALLECLSMTGPAKERFVGYSRKINGNIEKKVKNKMRLVYQTLSFYVLHTFYCVLVSFVE